nr:nucleotide-binding alpha-beta plait domain-containing protein [Tanacetum cinerariifolium]
MADEDDDGGEVEGDGGLETTADVVAADEDGGDVVTVVRGLGDGHSGDDSGVITNLKSRTQFMENFDVRLSSLAELVPAFLKRSKEDDVQKISTSVFVTNFSDGYGAKDLWNTCKLYGHVVDVFIHDRRTKAGKRFGFVRFIKVLDIDRLINNLCTVWVGCNKIHANVARFQREPLHKQSNKVNNKGTNNVNHGEKGMTNFYAHVVRGNQVQNVGMEECPNIVLDETCLNHEDFSLCLLGKGYDVNDGSHEDDMYGGVSENIKDVEGESDRKEVLETNFEEVPDKSIFEGNSVRQNDVHYEDLFGIYEVLNKKRDGKNIDDKHEDSLKYPPGFTPNEEGDVPEENVDNWSDENRVNNGQEDGKSKVPRKGGSILELIDDLVNVRQTMGYEMTGCIKNMEDIIESQGVDEIHR